MKLVKQAVVAVAILGVAALGYVYAPSLTGTEAGGAGGKHGQEAPRVIAEPARLEPERRVIEAVGTAEAARSATLHPAVAGEVVAVNIAPNQFVDKDAVLVELDHRAEDLAVELAEVRVEDARRLLARYDKTKGTGAVPESTVDEARTALEAARIELRQAQVARDDRRVVAPFAGYVDRSAVEVGDRVGPDQAITTVDDRRTLLIRFPLPEAVLGRLSPGQEVAVSPGLARDGAIPGEIVDLGSRVDPVTRSIEARARVDNADDRFRPGMSFSVRLDLLGETYALVPEVAVQWGAEGPYLWVVRGGKAHREPVRIVQRQEGVTLVDGAIEDGQPVVVEGVQRMREGLEVSYAPATPAAAGPAGS